MRRKISETYRFPRCVFIDNLAVPEFQDIAHGERLTRLSTRPITGSLVRDLQATRRRASLYKVGGISEVNRVKKGGGGPKKIQSQTTGNKMLARQETRSRISADRGTYLERLLALFLLLLLTSSSSRNSFPILALSLLSSR